MADFFMFITFENLTSRMAQYAKFVQGSAGCFLLLRYFSGVVSHPRDLYVSQYVVSVQTSSMIHHR